MSQLPVASRRARRRMVVPALAVLAVAGVVAGAVAFARHQGPAGGAPGANPPPLRLLDTGAEAAQAAAAPPGYGRPTVAGTLPTGPARAAVRTLPPGAAPAGTVAALATALGLPAAPARAAHGWRVSGAGRTLLVADTAGQPWTFGLPSGTAGPPACRVISSGRGRLCPPGVVVPPQPAPGTGSSAGSDSTGQGSAGAGSGGAGSGGATGGGSGGSAPGGLPVPAAPAGDPGRSSGAPAVPVPGLPVPGMPVPGMPVPGMPVPAVPVPVEPLPLPRVPTDASALLAARPVLAALGLAGAPTQVVRMPGQVSVLADPVVDGLVTSGFGTTLVIAPGGAVTAGSGWLGRPARGVEYPLLPAPDALSQVPVLDIARMCGSTVCPTPLFQVTGATLGLVLRWEAAGRPLLVPAWRYAVRDRVAPLVVVAVQPAYLGPAAGGGPGAPGGAVMPADPGAGQPGGGAPGAVPPGPATSH
jgi:hypothetical protein